MQKEYSKIDVLTVTTVRKHILPQPVLRFLHRGWQHFSFIVIGMIRPRLSPVSRAFGLDRGQSICRYYIETFLHHHKNDIRGCVLEVGDSTYTQKFGEERVSQAEVLHVAQENPNATIIGNFETGDNIPQQQFHCIILTQVLGHIYDVRTAITHIYHALRPGGIVLATLTGIGQISRYDMERWGDFWRFTDRSAQRLFEEVFRPENITMTTYGNVLAATAYLYGLSAEELTQKNLDYHDPDYQVLITVRAIKTPDRPT